MAEVMNTPFGDIDPAAVEAVVSGARGPGRDSVEEITIKFAKGLCGEPFISKNGMELVRIQIPNSDPNDHDPWQEFVLPTKSVHENQYGKGLWAKIPADGHTRVSRPFLAGKDENGRNIWKSEYKEVPNRELKEMVEFYKTRGRDAKSPAQEGQTEPSPAHRGAKEAAQRAEPEPEALGDKAGSAGRPSMKEQLVAGKKEAEKSLTPKAKAAKKLNKEPEL